MADGAFAKLGAIAEQRWGLVTTAQAEQAGVRRKQLARMAATGALERVAQGVYRIAGAPEAEHELTYATWLALGGARFAPGEVPPVVAAGRTAATLHGIGDFYAEGHDFVVPARKGTRLRGVRLRVRHLEWQEVSFVDGMPALTIERAVADLVEQWTDLSLVAGVVRDAIDQDKLVAPGRLAGYLAPLASSNGYPSGVAFARALFELTGAEPAGGYGDWIE